MRRFDWVRSSLGAVEAWPQALTTLVGVMLSSSQPMFIVWGARQSLLYNDSYARVLGDKHPQALAQPFLDTWAEIRDDLVPIVERAFAGTPVHMDDIELNLQRHGYPEETHFAFSYTPVRDETGGIAGIFCPCIETTSQVLAERRLATETVRQRRLFERAPGFITVLHGPAHVFEFVNEAYLQLFGDRDFLGKTVRDAFPELEGQNFFEWLDHVYQTGERFVAHHIPVQLRQSPGSPSTAHFIDFIYAPITDDAGTVTGIFCEGYDVTEVHLAQRELRASEARYRTLANSLRDLNETLEQRVAERTAERDRAWRNSRDLLLVLDDRGRFKAANPAWPRMLGWREDELLGRDYLDLAHPDDHAAIVEAFNIAREGELRRFEHRYRHRDGSYRCIEWAAAPEGPLVYATGRDVTAEKARSVQLEKAQEALRHAQKMESMGQLTGGVAHDFNNLLTPIIAVLDMLQRRGLGGEREQRLIGSALSAADRAKTLVQRLLAFARRQPLQPTAIEVGGLVRGMADLISGTTGPQISVVLDIHGDVPPALGDASQLEMAILNLAVNARDAMAGGGTLTVTVAHAAIAQADSTGLAPGEYVLLSVVDTGSGMDEATRLRAVEPFFSTKGVGKGTGLGLSMVHGLVTQLNGAFALASQPGAGTRVDLWLPVAAPSIVEEPVALERSDPVVMRGRALLVDDEPAVRAATADMLTELSFEVVEAACAKEALARFDDGLVVDLLITDHLMADMTGAELARRVRTRWPDTVVLVISGFAEAGSVPADMPFLTKPFRQAELAAALSDLMPRDPARRRVT